MKKSIQLSIISLAALLYLLKNAFGYSPTIVNVLNDLLALPVILLCMNAMMKLLYGNKFEMDLNFVMATFITISILFEVIFPLFSKSITADPVDIVLYFMGSVLFLTVKQFFEEKKTV